MFSKKLGSDLKIEEGSLVLVWRKPEDTGAAGVAEVFRRFQKSAPLRRLAGSVR
jgi:hypothetical protein